MYKMKTIPAAALMAILATTSAHSAEQFTLEQDTAPLVYDFGSHSIDVLGIAPGASASDAKQKVDAHYGNSEERIMWIGTRQVRSQQFVSTIDAGGPTGDDRLTIHLASPSVGNSVYAIHRTLIFDEGTLRPTIDEMKALLTQKYGEPSKVVATGSSNGAAMVWFLGGNDCTEQYICKPIDGFVNLRSYDPSEFGQYIDQMEVSSDVILYALIEEAHNANDGRVGSLIVDLLDVKRRGLSAQEDIRKINEAQQAFESQAPAMPKL